MDTNKTDACVIDDKAHVISYIYQAQKNSSLANPSFAGTAR